MAEILLSKLSLKKTEQLSKNYEIWYQDEVHFYRSSTICRMWAKRGKQPLVKSAPTQEKVAFCGFINPVTGRLFTTECNKFNFETIMEATSQFLNNYKSDKIILLILDNAPWHKKAVRLMRDDALYSSIEFLFLPSYSPELNPIERVWRITRKEKTHNRFFEKIDILRDTLLSYFQKFINPNNKLCTLCS